MPLAAPSQHEPPPLPADLADRCARRAAHRSGEAGRVYRIGYMSVVSRQSAEPLMVIFLQALRDLGWIEGRNLLVEWRWADGKVERLSGFAMEHPARRSPEALRDTQGGH